MCRYFDGEFNIMVFLDMMLCRLVDRCECTNDLDEPTAFIFNILLKVEQHVSPNIGACIPDYIVPHFRGP
jgi:hypothetical protein